MDAKPPTILVVLIQTEKLRWFVAGLGLDGELTPLICSDEDDLSPYRGAGPAGAGPGDLAEQLSFLRHRFCGVLQRGCFRLWEQQKKACQFVFVFEGLLPETGGGGPGVLTEAFADHMAEWMLNPPVAVLTYQPEEEASDPRSIHLDRIAGELEPSREATLLARFADLLKVQAEPGAWEQVREKGTWLKKPDEPAGR